MNFLQKHAARVQAISAMNTPPKTADGSLPFYQVDSLLKCPVIGVCLTQAEQRKIVRRAGTLDGNPLPFDMHEALVSLTDEDNTLARRVDALLRKKYEKEAAPLRRISLLDFMKVWDAAFTAGNFAAELWAAATRADMPRTLYRHIFGCVHMSMHDAFEAQPVLAAQLHQFRQERKMAEEKFRCVKLSLAQAHKDQRALKQERDAAQRHNTQLKAEIQGLGKALQASHTPAIAPQDNDLHLRIHIEELTQSLGNLTQMLRAEEKRHADTLNEMEIQRGLSLQLQKEIGLLLNSSAMCGDCTEECTECQCCPRKILIVGGMARMESLYRQLVEAKGDTFEHHDGNSGDVVTLKNSLQRADIVLCPTNCNSHRACLMVKELCKKYKKKLHIMPNFSLNAVAKVIESRDALH